MLRFPVFTVPTDSPVPAMLLLGSSYAIFTAAIWPSMYLEVNEEHRASAFAVASAGKNVSHVLCAWPHSCSLACIRWLASRCLKYKHARTYHSERPAV